MTMHAHHFAPAHGAHDTLDALDTLLGLVEPIELAARLAGRPVDDTGIEALARRIADAGHTSPLLNQLVDRLVGSTQAALAAVAALRGEGARTESVAAATATLVDELGAATRAISRRIA